MTSLLPHNAGPEHYCGLCRLNVPHMNVGNHREHLERLIIRCLVNGVILPSGVDYLFGLI